MIDEYLDQLEVELRRARHRRVRLAAARAPRVPAGAVAMVATVAVCAVVALAVLQAGGGRRVARPGAAVPVLAAVPVGARALVRELGVFRRPQTAADRIVGPIPHLFAFARLPGALALPQLTLVPSLTRLVVNLPAGRRIYLAIGRLAAGPRYVVVWLETPFVRYVNSSSPQGIPLGSSGRLGASPALLAGQLLHSAGNSVPEGLPKNVPLEDPRGLTGPKLWISIAPDSVVSARWTVRYGHRPRTTITLPVSNNVALLTVPDMQRDFVWKMSWLASNRHVIATWGRYSTAFQ